MEVFGSNPYFVVEARIVNHLDKSFSFDVKDDRIVGDSLVKIKTGEQRQVSRHVLQGIVSCGHGDFFVFFLPVRDYTPSFSGFKPGVYRIAIEFMRSDNNGGVTCYFSGFEFVK